MTRLLNIRGYRMLFLIVILFLLYTSTSLALTSGELYAENKTNLSDVSQGNIEQIIKDIVDYGPRWYGSKESSSRQQVSEFIRGVMESYGLQSSFEEFFDEPWDITGRNVIGVKYGSNLKDQIVIICAHYDTRPLSPGADDDASGVAVMLEIARLFQNYTLNRTVYFIAFDGEEANMRGSCNWMENHEDLKEDILAVVDVDMVAYGDDLSVACLPQHSWLNNLFQVSAESLNLTLNKERHRRNSGIYGDGEPFLNRYIPTIAIAETTINPYYHTENDTIENANISLAVDAAKIVAKSVYRLANPENVTPPEVKIEYPYTRHTYKYPYQSLTYNVSENNSIDVFIDGVSLGYIESGRPILWGEGKHVLKIRAIDSMGNVGWDTVIFEINLKAYYGIQTWENEDISYTTIIAIILFLTLLTTSIMILKLKRKSKKKQQ